MSESESDDSHAVSDSEDEDYSDSQETYFSDADQEVTIVEPDSTPKKLSDPDWKTFSLTDKKKFLSTSLQDIHVPEDVIDNFLASKRIELMKDLEREKAKAPGAPKKASKTTKRPRKITLAALKRMEKKEKEVAEQRAKTISENERDAVVESTTEEKTSDGSGKKTKRPKRPANKRQNDGEQGSSKDDDNEAPGKKKTKFVARMDDATTVDLSERSNIRFQNIILGDGYYLRSNYVDGKKSNGEKFRFTAIILGRDQSKKGKKNFEMTLPIKYGPKMYEAIGLILAEDGKEYVPK